MQNVSVKALAKSCVSKYAVTSCAKLFSLAAMPLVVETSSFFMCPAPSSQCGVYFDPAHGSSVKASSPFIFLVRSYGTLTFLSSYGTSSTDFAQFAPTSKFTPLLIEWTFRILSSVKIFQCFSVTLHALTPGRKVLPTFYGESIAMTSPSGPTSLEDFKTFFPAAFSASSSKDDLPESLPGTLLSFLSGMKIPPGGSSDYFSVRTSMIFGELYIYVTLLSTVSGTPYAT